jgi:hypothetical protein
MTTLPEAVEANAQQSELFTQERPSSDSTLLGSVSGTQVPPPSVVAMIVALPNASDPVAQQSEVVGHETPFRSSGPPGKISAVPTTQVLPPSVVSTTT